jgi:hypothetical protein
VVTAVGVPVYYHYCGGELEEVNYVLKGNSCCGGEDTQEEDNGCCKDENYILKSDTDFTIKDLQDYSFLKSNEVSYVTLPFSVSINHLLAFPRFVHIKSPPAKLQHTLVISTSVLRI